MKRSLFLVRANPLPPEFYADADQRTEPVPELVMMEALVKMLRSIPWWVWAIAVAPLVALGVVWGASLL